MTEQRNRSTLRESQPDQKKSSRREFLERGSGIVLAATLTGASHGQGTQSPQAMKPAERGKNASDFGPENDLLKQANPNTFLPPTTDHGEVPSFWNSFATSHRRIQEGGWSRQVTVADFPLSRDIAGVNMRLTAGGIRELHWHDAAEWALMLNGTARITAIDNDGRSFVADVGKNDLWYFPTGTPHSIQGLAPEGSEFLLVFDDGSFSEANTTQISDWSRHTPSEVLAKNWGVSPEALKSVYGQPADGHYIFQGEVPPPLEEDIRSSGAKGRRSAVDFSFLMSKMAPSVKARYGEVRIIDSKNFPVATTISAAQVILKPGGLRELHWHQNANEWQYYIQGQGRMTVFFNGAKARTADFNAGDVGYVPKTFGHYVENVGDTDLIFLEMFKSNRYMDLSLSEWVSNTPAELVMAHLGISRETLEAIPKTKAVIVPA